jgi:hypothetical protein
MSAATFAEQIQALLYGKLEVEFVEPTYAEQLEIVRALVANPSAYSRLRIKGTVHPWINRIFESSPDFCCCRRRP